MGNKPWPADAPPGKTWKCPDCGSQATLGGNAGFHRDKKKHGEPVLVDFKLEFQPKYAVNRRANVPPWADEPFQLATAAPTVDFKVTGDPELNALDDWCAEHVLGLKLSPKYPKGWTTAKGVHVIFTNEYTPTTSTAQAADVFKRCCIKSPLSVDVSCNDDLWYITRPDMDSGYSVGMCPTWEIAVCQFAKLLFSDLKK